MDINPKILVWAREAAGLSLEEAAVKLRLTDTKSITAVEKLVKYEDGSRLVSKALLNKFVNVYKKPLLTFYLENPPKKGNYGEDFRRSTFDISKKETLLIDTLLTDIKTKQEIIKSALIEEDEAINIEFVNKFGLKNKVETVSKQIQNYLGFDLSRYRKFSRKEDAFKYIRGLVEDKGVFVILASNLGSHHTRIDLHLFRGFALADPIAPFIVINNQDSKSALSFTLLHELAHIFIGKTGISNNDYIDNKVEVYCNNIASDMLLPDDMSIFYDSTSDFDNLKNKIGDFSQKCNVSHTSVAYKLLKEDIIDEDTWIKFKNFYYEKWRDARLSKRYKSTGGPNQNTVRKFNLGPAVMRLVKRMSNAGTLSTAKAAIVLGVKPTRAYKLLNH